ncbi:hypothetical protein JOC36_000132 [Weissella uvarum]|uniref:hypothetical protein n=1 Tax=Weissella uvarum TaxID=1479233 RepID=UPI00195F5FB0|nr:hypothetical protein [Weissella uvarum]MBM7616599.1 hypothetical protein [Weissella uvarum]MCM0594942.1 hypothetical protein [Weissella uvarum]
MTMTMTMALWVNTLVLVVGFIAIIGIPFVQQRKAKRDAKRKVLDVTLNFINYIYDEILTKQQYDLKKLDAYKNFETYKVVMSITRVDDDFAYTFLDDVDDALKQINGTSDSVFQAYELIKNLYMDAQEKIDKGDL